MIVRMSKLEIAGPKELLLDALDVIRGQAVFQPESDATGFVRAGRRSQIRSLVLDERTAAERLFLGHLLEITSELIELLPPVETRTSWLDPMTVLDTFVASATRHLNMCRDLTARREEMRREREEMERYAVVLGALDTLIRGTEKRNNLEFIGLTLRDPRIVDRLRDLLTQLTDGEFSFSTTMAADGTMIALIVTPPARATAIRAALNEEQLPELPFPQSLKELTLPERIMRIRERLDAAERGIREITGELERFARQWLAIYLRTDQWLRERLALISTTGVVQETGMCFVIHGWARSDAVTGLAAELNARFAGRVVLEEQRILEQDLERVPVALKNPPYIRSFELFTRMLPLPRYSSWDPTPFVAFFFPLFFGMMLGDAGHGLLLVIVALLLLRRRDGTVKEVARILLISASYAVVFGVLFGEFFGEAGARMLHMEPLVLERSRAIMPMLIFALAMGGAHMLLGMTLGLISSLRRSNTREAISRLVSIVLICCLAALIVSLVYPSSWLLTRPILIVAGILVPFLFLSGGFLAPLELLRHIGNIISYARIMAIGLSSVLLANAANHLAGLSGDLILGALTAVVLHAVAIVLGVFAPAIHGLRLHFVEFFGTFVESGGRKFEPLRKKD